MQFNAVVETNTRAVALWRSLGFELLGTLPEGFHHPVEGYVGPAHHVPPPVRADSMPVSASRTSGPSVARS